MYVGVLGRRADAAGPGAQVPKYSIVRIVTYIVKRAIHALAVIYLITSSTRPRPSCVRSAFTFSIHVTMLLFRLRSNCTDLPPYALVRNG